MRAAVVAALLAFVVPGDHATATYANGTLTLSLRYEMTCGRPGPGPLAIELPQRFAVDGAHAVGRSSTTVGHTISVAVPGPHGITCMSITEGTLRVHVAGLQAPAGSYLVRAEIRRHAFTARLRVP